MKIDFKNFKIDKELAQELNMTIWQGTDHWYAQKRDNRESRLYGYTFVIIN